MLVETPTARADLSHPAGRVASIRLLIADPAPERRADPFLPAVRREDPVPLLPRRAVSDVLTVAAGKEGHPLPHVVLLEGNDGAVHVQLAPEPASI